MIATGPQNRLHTIALFVMLPLALTGCFSSSSGDKREVVEGTISIEPGTAVDHTVNNPEAGDDDQTNNAFSEAQRLSNPATVGGYAHVETDPVDYYTVELSEGQRVRLRISDYASDHGHPVDLDLFLLNGDREIIAQSAAPDARVEEIVVPSDEDVDQYVIKVSAAHRGSNYILTLGQGVTTPGTASSAYAQGRPSDFVPGDIIVHFENDMLQNQGIDVNTMAGTRSRQLALEHRGGGPGVGTLMHFPDAAAGDQAMLAMGEGENMRAARRGRSELPTATRRHLETIAMAKALRRQDGIRDTELNAVFRSQSTPQDEFLELQWNVPLIDMSEAWAQTTGDDQVLVAVIDTEIYAAHPDLEGKITDGADFSPDCGVDNPSIPDATRFHGTHVAGIISAATNNERGISGIGWRTRIMPVTALCGDGFGTTMSVRESVRYAAGLDDGDTEPRADIINLSLGGGTPSDTDEALYRDAAEAGVIVVAAAGNDGDSRKVYPAGYDHVLSVGAVGADTTRAPYSNFGESLDLVAPGGNMSQDLTGDGYPDGILSTSAATRSDGEISANYVFSQGTSMAAPHVAGVLALMRSIDRSIGFDQVIAWIQADDSPMTEPLGDAGAGEHDDQYGYGLINAANAVRLVGDIAAPSLRASPRSLAFEVPTSNSETGEFALTSLNDDDDTLEVTGVTSDRDWITVEAGDNSTDRGLGSYKVTVDATNLNEGSFVGTVHAETNTGATASVRISLSVTGLEARGDEDAGLKYVQLRDASTFALAQQVAINATDGRYTYRFEDVEPGEYVVIAGTDNDNDGFICDAGEACGAYPTLDRIERFTVGTSETVRRDFTTGYRAGLESSTALDILGDLERQTNEQPRFRRQQ